MDALWNGSEVFNYPFILSAEHTIRLTSNYWKFLDPSYVLLGGLGFDDGQCSWSEVVYLFILLQPYYKL